MVKAFGVEQGAGQASVSRTRGARSSGASGSSGRIAQAVADTVSGVASYVAKGAPDRRAGRDIAAINEQLDSMRVGGKNIVERKGFRNKKINDLTKKYGADYGRTIKDGTSLTKTKQVYNRERNSYQILDAETNAVYGERPAEDFMNLDKATVLEMSNLGGQIEGATPKVGEALATTVDVTSQAGDPISGQYDMMRQLQTISSLPERVDRSVMRMRSLSRDVSLTGDARNQKITAEYDEYMSDIAGAMEFYVNSKRGQLLKDNKSPYDLNLVKHNLSALKAEAHTLMVESGFLDAAQITKADSRAMLDGFADLYGQIAKTALEDERFSVETGIAVVEAREVSRLMKVHGPLATVQFMTEKIKAVNAYATELGQAQTTADPSAAALVSRLVAAGPEGESTGALLRNNTLVQVENAVADISTVAKLTKAYALTTSLMKNSPFTKSETAGFAAVSAEYWTKQLPKISRVLKRELGSDQAEEVLKEYEDAIAKLSANGKGIDPVKFTRILEQLALPIRTR
jgi:hypothetical protein